MSDQELNHHNDPSGLAASAGQANTGRPYLGSLDDIDVMLREFTEGVTGRFVKVGRGLLTPDAAADADRAECERMAAIFNGQDDTYAAIEHWNGSGLANYIRGRMAESVQPGDDKDIIAQAFGLFVHRIYGAINDAGSTPAPEVLAATLTDNVRSFSWALVGLESNE